MRVAGIGLGGRPIVPFGVSHGNTDLLLAEPGLEKFADGLIGMLLAAAMVVLLVDR
jgi:hypothetical protein